MSLLLQDFAIGDTNYISKLNGNSRSIETAFNGLAARVGGTVMGALTAPTAFSALFGPEVAIIGASSLVATPVSTNLSISPGYAWLPSSSACVYLPDTTLLAFATFGAGDYYVIMDEVGVPAISTSPTEALYSVHWTGAAFTDLTRTANLIWAGEEWVAAQTSDVLGVVYDTLDERLEAVETLAVNGNTTYAMLTTKVTKDVSGGADVTLSAAESKAIYFEFTGALTANININFPLTTTPKLINVKNSTTGNFTLTCKGSAGTGKKVTQGFSTLFHHNGTNMEYALDDPSTIAKQVTYGSSLTIDWSQYDVAYLILTGDTTLTFTGGRPGQKCLLYVEQDATGAHTVTWPSDVRFGTDVGGIALTSAGNKVDEIAFSYNWVRGLYNTVSVARGYDNA